MWHMGCKVWDACAVPQGSGRRLTQNGNPTAGGVLPSGYGQEGDGCHTQLSILVVFAVQPDNSAEDCNGSHATQEQGVES